jgi:transposase-like protein
VKKTRRKIDSALKVEIVFEALRGQKSVADLAQQYGLHPNQIYAWQRQLKTYAAFAFDGHTRHIAELKGKISRDALKSPTMADNKKTGSEWGQSDPAVCAK